MSTPQGPTVIVEHDAAEGIWYVIASDVPGLNAEAASFDELVATIQDLAPDLLAANSREGAVLSDTPLVIQHTVSLARERAA